MSGIKLLLILVIAVLIVVLFKYVQIKRQIRNLSKQMTDLTTGKSEKMLDISLVDKDIEQLAAVLNQYNEKQRQSIASTLRHEMYLKESIANISHDLRSYGKGEAKVDALKNINLSIKKGEFISRSNTAYRNHL